MAGRLDGKYAIVTGAASGMGREIALAFLREGAGVFSVDMNETRLKEVEEQAKEMGLGDMFAYTTANITSTEDCNAAVEKAVAKFGTLNVLSHNAGIIDDYTVVGAIDDAKWDKVIAVNLTGSMKVARACLKYFVENDIKANMVMTTSNAAFESATGGPAYCASKAGANGLMKSIAYEYATKGIRCNSICPGPVASNIQESSPMNLWNPEGVAIHLQAGYNAVQQTWTGVPYWSADCIAPLAVYLASDESKIVNGSSIVADGGVCLSR